MLLGPSVLWMPLESMSWYDRTDETSYMFDYYSQVLASPQKVDIKSLVLHAQY